MHYSQVLAQYQTRGDSARLKASQAMSGFLGKRVTLSPISLRALEGSSEWYLAKVEPSFDWTAIRHKYRTDPKKLEIAIWSGDALCGLGLGLLTNQALEIRFVEGNPRTDCPLRGKRLLTILECAANYAQACGRKEIRLQPANERLAELYERTYGFVRDVTRDKSPFFKKEV